MLIEIVFDTICPWCYIGKRRLEKAMSLCFYTPLTLVWKPFLLNPSMPTNGMDRQDYLRRKFGDRGTIDSMLSMLSEIGQAEGIDFRFDKITRTPNSLLSHRLIAFASRFSRQSDLAEKLFYAYFTEGRDIGDKEQILAIGSEAGLPEKVLKAYLNDHSSSLLIEEENAFCGISGISGVPLFVFNRGHAIAGAQDSDVLARMIQTSGYLTREHSLMPSKEVVA